MASIDNKKGPTTMNPKRMQPATPLFDRRGFLSWATCGLGGAALAALLGRDRRVGATQLVAGHAGCPHHPPKATRAIHICLVGALSQVDSFDYKPELARLHGQSLNATEQPDVFFGQNTDGELKREMQESPGQRTSRDETVRPRVVGQS